MFTRAVPNRFVRYLMRCMTMLHVSFFFIAFVWIYIFKLVAHDKQLTNLRGWGHALKFMFGTPGTFRKIFPDWLEWFKPGFHPWQHDNRALLGDVQLEFKDARVVGASA